MPGVESVATHRLAALGTSPRFAGARKRQTSKVAASQDLGSSPP